MSSSNKRSNLTQSSAVDTSTKNSDSIRVPSSNTSESPSGSSPNIKHQTQSHEEASNNGSERSVKASRENSGKVSAGGRQKLNTLEAVAIIERVWVSYRDQQIFRLLKHAVCAAESSLSYEILKKVAPREAELLKDKSQKCRIRFRFGGCEFPPVIFFKVYTSSEKGPKVTYVNGRNMIQASSQAARDACDLMGNRLYFETLIQDTMQHEHYGVTDESDVTTLKDYMQYLSRMDELPAHMGGRENSWRKLTLEALPRHIIFYDIVEFAYKHEMSEALRAEAPSLLLRPTTQDVQFQHMQIISSYRPPLSVPYTVSRSTNNNAISQTSSRRSRQAKQRVLKMKRMYDSNRELSDVKTAGREKTFDTVTSQVRIDPVAEVFGDAAADVEAQQLYEWTQNLSLDDLGLTSRMNTRSLTQGSLIT